MADPRVVDPMVRNIKETGSLKVGKDRFWLLHCHKDTTNSPNPGPVVALIGRVFIIDCWLSKPRSSFDRCKCFGHAVELCRVGGSTVGTLYWVGTKRNKLRIWLKGSLNPFVLATALFDLCRKQGECRMLSGNINIYEYIDNRCVILNKKVKRQQRAACQETMDQPTSSPVSDTLTITATKTPTMVTPTVTSTSRWEGDKRSTIPPGQRNESLQLQNSIALNILNRSLKAIAICPWKQDAQEWCKHV